MSIDHGADVPVYRQLAEVVAARIEDGTYQPRRAIPSEKQLGQEFGVSRVTVRSAVAWLRDQGLVYTVPHRGTYVSPRS
jgi:DNA-binding GntR family transcriptional regulator